MLHIISQMSIFVFHIKLRDRLQPEKKHFQIPFLLNQVISSENNHNGQRLVRMYSKSTNCHLNARLWIWAEKWSAWMTLKWNKSRWNDSLFCFQLTFYILFLFAGRKNSENMISNNKYQELLFAFPSETHAKKRLCIVMRSVIFHEPIKNSTQSGQIWEYWMRNKEKKWIGHIIANNMWCIAVKMVDIRP